MNYLYKITNSINNKIYVGVTTNTRQRWYAHKNIVKIKLEHLSDILFPEQQKRRYLKRQSLGL